MTLSRRDWLAATGAFAAGALVSTPEALQAAEAAARQPARSGRVHTPNGWTLPYRMNDGVKEFHLVAEPVEHTFAPGATAACWGYNGGTPGPTIEAVEGDRVRIFVTNRLPEHTSVHWHGILLPCGMDGVSGLTQPPILPGETYAYEFTLRQHGTFLYHPHADEMVQLALGMMGFFIVHPRGAPAVDRDFAVMLHQFALHPGTSRPDPNVMLDASLWTMNSKVFPAIEPLVCAAGERVRVRMANLSMWNHPIHLHGHQFEITGSDGGRWPKSQWRREITEIVGVGQCRDLEFDAIEGDWAFHCHMSHHTMGPMGHDVPNTLGADQRDVAARIRKHLPGYMPMGERGMAEHQMHTDMGHMPGPFNTLPMMTGQGPFGRLEMGGMFNVVKVRKGWTAGDFRDPGWYAHPKGTLATRVSDDPEFGKPVRR